MKKRGVSRKFLTVALALGLLANAGGNQHLQRTAN
jgi:hypothetical protein